ncbi:uncharacterized protein LOC125758556 [Rhipicephalus sanguineus]|uniref:uncharacterized protein LOC125758556 n=1 Tax=Rhipicephalus sanguineus TaxID=34632 RepID=UPI0020C4B5DB|nr:uncharacterized protein LOC125758556 [Rhipicephalus sanguineus]
MVVTAFLILFLGFTIVRFAETNDVEAVPSSWVCGHTCLWPVAYTPARLTKAISHCELPSASFSKHRVVVIATASTYLHARAKAREAEDTDNVPATDTEMGRGKRRRRNGHEMPDEPDLRSSPSPSSSTELEPGLHASALGTPPRFVSDDR